MTIMSTLCDDLYGFVCMKVALKPQWGILSEAGTRHSANITTLKSPSCLCHQSARHSTQCRGLWPHTIVTLLVLFAKVKGHKLNCYCGHCSSSLLFVKKNISEKSSFQNIVTFLTNNQDDGLCQKPLSRLLQHTIVRTL